MLSGCGFAEVGGGVAYRTGGIGCGDFEHALFKKAEEAFCMGIFLSGCFEEDSCNLLVAFLLSHFGKDGVAAACLRFTGK